MSQKVARASAAARRCWNAIRATLPNGAPGYALAGILLVGTVLRLIAIVSWWPVTTTLEDGYQQVISSPFNNPLHPAGYTLVLAGVRLLTHEVAAPILLQHLSGIASALLLWAATRRLTGSAWPGLLPAGIVLLDPDFIFLEHALMSESWVVLATSAGLYAAVRTLDRPAPYWRWPLLTGVFLALAVTIRTAALPLVLVAALALLICRPRSLAGRRVYRRAALVVLGASAGVLFAFATANAIFGERFGLGASPGWYLYARAAQFADCARFTPPSGTEVLCQSQPADERPDTRYYLLNPNSPAERNLGPFGDHDDLLGQWAKRAILAQPRDYLANVWTYLSGYWFPDQQWQIDQGLDPELAFTNGLPHPRLYGPMAQPAPGGSTRLEFVEAIFQQTLEPAYNPITIHKQRAGLEFLRSWQLVVRFGATALLITTLLVPLGLVIGTRRSRLGVLLFGVGGLTLIVAPALTANYWGRYTIPMAGPLMAAAAITMTSLWRAYGSKRETTSAGAAGSG